MLHHRDRRWEAGPYYDDLPFGKDDDDRDWAGGGLVGDPGTPFPHQAAWNLPDSFWEGEPDWPDDAPAEEQVRLMEAWDRELEAHSWNPAIMAGAIQICRKGCALRQWLVIQGERRGFIWDDKRVDHAGIAPVLDASGQPVTFTGWYTAWLDDSLGGKNDLPTPPLVPWWRRGRRPIPRSRRGNAMKPVSFSCRETLPCPPERIARLILDLSLWPQFRGYGVLPGIKSAEFERQTPEIVGTRIRVANTDGSTHVEEIVEWDPQRRLMLRMGDFSPPLSRLATHFEESWDFSPAVDETQVVRSFELQPMSARARPVLWMISLFLKRAIDGHLREMREAMSGEMD
ncbi:SRPBCC family protein [Paludisphaera soli]|uniref:SRPBCC family protein n=1 Tax=Paludisphaera soli TaxID=2712865 RepID=UPI0013EBFE06|nr:SRPBCC family protein [Paludisphaera soli]